MALKHYSYYLLRDSDTLVVLRLQNAHSDLAVQVDHRLAENLPERRADVPPGLVLGCGIVGGHGGGGVEGAELAGEGEVVAGNDLTGGPASSHRRVQFQQRVGWNTMRG
jgi:hypothetical protein